MFRRPRATVNQTGLSWSTINRGLQVLWQAWLPPTCCLCGARGRLVEGGAPLDLCDLCDADLPRIATPAGGSASTRVFAPFRYAWPVNEFVRHLKFNGELEYARLLGTLLALAIREARIGLPDLIVPIPLHRRRYLERGFNQAAEIARYAGRILGCATSHHALERSVATAPQSDLTALARRRNVRKAFRATRRLDGRRLVIVDDVITTGSTVAEAARVLRSAGAAEVTVWAAARAQPSALSSATPTKITSPT